MVLQAQATSDKTSEALEILSVAIERDPKNAQVQYVKLSPTTACTTM